MQQRVIGAAPHGHCKTSTFVAGLRRDRIVAPLVLDGAINGRSCRAYVEQFPAPTLPPGDVVVTDSPVGPAQPCGARSDTASTASRQPNAATPSPTQATHGQHETALASASPVAISACACRRDIRPTTVSY